MEHRFHILKIQGRHKCPDRVQLRDWKFDLLFDLPIQDISSDQQFLAFRQDYPKLDVLIDSAPYQNIIRLDL